MVFLSTLFIVGISVLGVGPCESRPPSEDLFLFARFWYEEDIGFEEFDFLPNNLICTLECLCSPVGQSIWFVDNTAPEGGNGSMAHPFNRLKLAEAVASPGHTLFIYRGDGSTTGLDEGVVLKSRQRLFGESVGLTVGDEIIVPPGGPPTMTNLLPNGRGIELGDNNMVAGITVHEAFDSGIFGENILSGTIESVTVTNSLESGIELVQCSGLFELGGVSLADASRANLLVSGGDVDLRIGNSLPCSIENSNAPGSALVVQATHTGNLEFRPNTTIHSTIGDGLQFSNADGSYLFDGSITLSGGDAGIDILNNSAGTFTFGPNTTITNPSGTAVNIRSLSAGAQFDYDGDIVNNINTIFSIDSTEPGSEINFNSNGANSLSSTNSPSGAFFIFDADGDINLNTPATIRDAGFSSLFATDGSGVWSFNDWTIENQHGLNGGIDLFGQMGTVNFTNLTITTNSAGSGDATTGFLAGGCNIINVAGTNSVEADGGGALVLINIATVNMTFESLSSTNNTNTQIGFSGDDGIDLLSIDGGTIEVTGTTTVTNADGAGISIEEVGAAVSFENVMLSGIGRDGIISGVVFANPGSIKINGGSISGVGMDGIRLGSNTSGVGASLFRMNDTSVNGIGGFTVSISNSDVGGEGNTATPFSCNDRGGNTGSILFNNGTDSCP